MFRIDPTIGWSTIVQIVGFVVAFMIAIFQINKQRSLQAEKHRIDLQLKTYEEIAQSMHFVSPVEVATTLQIVHGALEEAVKRKEQSGTYAPPPFDPETLDKEFRDIYSGLWLVAAKIQNHEIVSPNLPLFREALIIKLKHLADAYLPLARVLPYVLISGKGIKDPNQLRVPTSENFVAMQEKIDAFQEVAYDVASFLHDIQVEMQNSLLGPFFGRRTSIRTPEDDSFLVLTSENPDMLRRVEVFVNENQ